MALVTIVPVANGIISVPYWGAAKQFAIPPLDARAVARVDEPRSPLPGDGFPPSATPDTVNPPQRRVPPPPVIRTTIPVGEVEPGSSDDPNFSRLNLSGYVHLGSRQEFDAFLAVPNTHCPDHLIVSLAPSTVDLGYAKQRLSDLPGNMYISLITI